MRVWQDDQGNVYAAMSEAFARRLVARIIACEMTLRLMQQYGMVALIPDEGISGVFGDHIGRSLWGGFEDEMPEDAKKERDRVYELYKEQGLLELAKK